MTELVALLVFIIAQIIIIPLVIMGLGVAAYRQVLVSKRLGVSSTYVTAGNFHFMGHKTKITMPDAPGLLRVLMAVIACMSICCSPTGPGGKTLILHPSISGMKYVFRGNGSFDSAQVSGAQVPQLAYPDRLYDSCNPAESILTVFPANLSSLTIYPDSTALFLGTRCSLFTVSNIVLLISTEMIPFLAIQEQDCYVVGIGFGCTNIPKALPHSLQPKRI